MAAKFFGQFLLERGVINREQLLQALELQRQSNPLLGEIAERMGLLNATDVRRINDQQRREDKRFGDIAVALGLLDEAQVGRLIAKQQASRKLFGEILLEIGALDADTLGRELDRHREQREQAVDALQLGMTGHRYGELAPRAAATATTLFGRVLHLPCQLAALMSSAELAAMPIAAQVLISGDRSFRLAIGCDEAMVLTIGRGFLAGAVPPEIVDAELARDALGEFLNIVMGYVVKEQVDADQHYTASPPQFDRDPATIARDDADTLALRLTTPSGDIALLVGG